MAAGNDEVTGQVCGRLLPLFLLTIEFVLMVLCTCIVGACMCFAIHVCSLALAPGKRDNLQDLVYIWPHSIQPVITGVGITES